MDIKKVKMKKINKNTVLTTGDRVFLKAYFLEGTLLNKIPDGFVINYDQTNHTYYVRRKALEDYFLKILV